VTDQGGRKRKGDGLGRAADWLSRVVLVVICLSAIAWAAGVLYNEGDRAFAARLELLLGSRTATAEEIARGRIVLGKHGADCAGEFRRTASALALFDADAAGYTGGTGEAAIEAIKQQLRCTPADANAWLLLAIAEQRLGLPSQNVSQRVAMSYRYGPREGWIAGRRLLFLCQNADGIPETLRADAMRDFGGILEARRLNEVVDAYRACPAEDRKRLDVVLVSASSEARAAFARAAALQTAPGQLP
jgi:hypothetical protein